MRIRSHAAHVVAALTVGLALTACSRTAQDPPTSAPATTTSPASSPTAVSSSAPSSEQQAALESYDRYWEAQIASQANPAKPQDPDLARYATGDALAGAQSALLLFRQNGIAMTGRPQRQLVSISTSTSPARVSIVDCIDSSKWKPVYVATGKSALAPGQSSRVPIASTVELKGDRWVVTESVAQRDRSC